MATPEAPTEEQTVSGQVLGVTAKGGDNWQIAVQPPDSQYAKNIWTKEQELVQTMTGMIGRQVTFFCRVSHWTRGDGQSVRSLWANGWVEGIQNGGGSMQPIQPQQFMPQQPPQQQTQQQTPPQQPWTPQQQFMPPSPAPTLSSAAQPGPNVSTAPYPSGAQDFQVGRELRIMRQSADKCAAQVLSAMIEHMESKDLTPERLHGFMDGFARRRLSFYETGSSVRPLGDDEIPFAWEDGYGREMGVHHDPWRIA